MRGIGPLHPYGESAESVNISKCPPPSTLCDSSIRMYPLPKHSRMYLPSPQETHAFRLSLWILGSPDAWSAKTNGSSWSMYVTDLGSGMGPDASERSRLLRPSPSASKASLRSSRLSTVSSLGASVLGKTGTAQFIRTYRQPILKDRARTE